MRVTRLEIFGFKSFVDRFVLNFDKSLIGVVGPNGCGKSNIVDSLRWVLGETHAKQLRGGVLEDLIFNGSDSRRPLGMAEVSITVRPHEGWAPATVLRLQELAQSDSGRIESSESDSVVEESELAIEAVEPIKIELPAQNANTGANTASTLLQLPGLFDAAEIQLTRRLYRSGESEYFINRVPCRLRDMVEFYRIIGLGSRGLSIVQQGQVGDIISRKPEELRELLEEAAGIAGFRSRIDAAERRLQKTTDNIARLKDLSIEREKHVRTLGRQAKRAKERNSIREELRSKELELFQLRGALIVKKDEEAIAQLEQGELALLEYRTRLDEIIQNTQLVDLELLEEEVGSLRKNREGILSEIRAHQEKEQELRLALSRTESKAKGNRFQLAEILDQQDRNARELQAITGKIAESTPQLEIFVQKKQAAEELLSKTLASGTAERSEALLEIDSKLVPLRQSLEARADYRNGLNRINEELRLLRGKERELAQLIAGKRTELARAQGQEKAIEDQLSEIAKVAENSLGEDKQQVLIQGITAPEGLELALLAALGEKGKFIVSEEPSDLLGKIKEHDKSRKGVGVLRASEGSAQFSAKLLLGNLKIESWAAGAVQRLLGSIYLAEDVAEAEALKKEFGQEITVVTKSGVLLAPWGWFASGEVGIQSFRLTRLLEESRVKALKLAEDIRALNDSENEIQSDTREKERAKGEFEEKLVALEQVGREIAELERKERQIEREEQERRLRAEREVQEQLRKASNELSSFQGQLSHLTQSLESRERESSRFEARLTQIGEEWSSISSEYLILREKVLLEGKIELPESLDLLLANGNVQLKVAVDSSIEERLMKAESEVTAKELELRTARKKQNEYLSQKDSLQSEVSRRMEAIQELRLKGERTKVELEHLRTEVVDKFGEGFELPIQEEFQGLELSMLEQKERAIADKVRSIRHRLDVDGEVDPSVIEEYEVEREKFAALESQIEDLVSAEKTLERTIRHLRELSKIKFIETYKDVSERFTALIPRLFGGGAGQMDLSNPEDPLSTGVIISVRPPGKKLRSLDLLSGGEKALTATAVLLAMFLHRPSPICVLDEVDAPLDDANLERFLNLIREIAGATQMLIITHNKQSMLASERLVGITMQEPGVSKALTVSFEEAVEELERFAANG